MILRLLLLLLLLLLQLALLGSVGIHLAPTRLKPLEGLRPAATARQRANPARAPASDCDVGGIARGSSTAVPR